jgi:FkbM family methyltransferase
VAVSEDTVIELARVGKYQVYVDRRDVTITPHLIRDGFWESWITKAILDFIRPEMTCVDIGAHYGYYTVLMAERVKRVLAFEPNCVLLLRTIELNRIANVSVSNIALSDSARSEQFHMSESHSGACTIMPPVNGMRHVIGEPGYSSRMVLTNTLDNELGDTPVDFIKCDAERAEPLIWRGMVKTWKANPNLVMCLESLGTPDERAKLYDLLIETARVKVVSTAGRPEVWTREQIISSQEADMLWVTHR